MERQDGGSLLNDLVSDIRSGVKDPGQQLLNRIRTESVRDKNSPTSLLLPSLQKLFRVASENTSTRIKWTN